MTTFRGEIFRSNVNKTNNNESDNHRACSESGLFRSNGSRVVLHSFQGLLLLQRNNFGGIDDTHTGCRSRSKGRSRGDESKGAGSGELHGGCNILTKYYAEGEVRMYGIEQPLSPSKATRTASCKDLSPGDTGKVKLRSNLFSWGRIRFRPFQDNIFHSDLALFAFIQTHFILKFRSGFENQKKLKID